METDGSKIKNRVESAIYIPSEEYQEKNILTLHSSIFAAELDAISMALDYIKRRNLSRVVIFIDSKSVLIALNNQKNNGSKLYYDIIHNIFELQGDQRQIELVWMEIRT